MIKYGTSSSPPDGTEGHVALTERSRAAVYMGAPASLASAENGAIFNHAIQDNAKEVKHQDREPYALTEGVWVLPGPSVNAALIEGPDGLIVWETGDHMEHGRRYLEQIRRISKKPIRAVIYSHTHYTKGTAAIIEGESDVMIIGHPRLNENMQVSSVGSYFPEIEPLQRARGHQHAQLFLPDEGPDAKYGFVLELGERGFVPVNTPVAHGEELVVAGVRLKFLTDGGSDTDDCVTVWLPDRKVLLNNILWPWQPNFYTPRGAKFRDPRNWATALRDILALPAEYLINQHGRSIAGIDEIRRTLRNYLDFTSLVLDQTLRGILQGLGPEDLRGFIRLPPHLAQDPWLFESYGQLDWHAPYIMQYAIGWWDGDAATLVRLPPREIAERLVPLIGGREKLLAAARQAQADGELAWALELLNYQFRLTPSDPEIRQLKADMLRSCGQASTASITRAFMLSQALDLEGKVRLPRVVLPTPQQICVDPIRFVAEMRVRIDPMRAQDVDQVMRFDFTDQPGKSAALHVRRGVVEFVGSPADHYRVADFALALDGAGFAALFLNQESLASLLKRGAVAVSGDAGGACLLLDLFDPLSP